MGDAFTDQVKAVREAREWEDVTVPHIEKTLLGKKPEELNYDDNLLMSDYYKWKRLEEVRKAESEINMKYNHLIRDHFDAAFGQGKYSK